MKKTNEESQINKQGTLMDSQSQTQGSVTRWIAELNNNDPIAAQKIWERFVERLVRIAERQLRYSKCRGVDGEEVVADAFRDFFRKTPSQFEQLVDRNDLWQILVMITERRAIDTIRRESSQRRGGGRIVGESVVRELDGAANFGFDSFASAVNPPDVELMLIEAVEDRLGTLECNIQRQIAIDKMEGLKNEEIAIKNKISLRSVERKLAMIRQYWEQPEKT